MASVSFAQRIIKAHVDNFCRCTLVKQTREQPVFFLPIREMKRGVIPAKKFAWMRVKSNYRRYKIIALRRFSRCGNNLLMPAMHAIEIANCRS